MFRCKLHVPAVVQRQSCKVADAYDAEAKGNIALRVPIRFAWTRTPNQSKDGQVRQANLAVAARVPQQAKRRCDSLIPIHDDARRVLLT